MSRKGKRLAKNKKIRNIIIALLLLIFISIITYLIYYFCSRQQDKNVIGEIRQYMTNVEGTSRIDKLKGLQEQNPDIKGWIEIENTKINFPLLQANDNNYYLTHDYKKEKNKYGSIFLKSNCNINDVNSNLIIYGHNMKDSEMFNSLLEYQNRAYYEEHKTVKMITENEEREYEIIAAFKSRIFYKDEKDVFRYYYTLDFKSEEEYNQYISNVKKIQLYDTGVEAKYGEQLMTMITCEYSQENGRMVVVAKRINT